MGRVFPLVSAVCAAAVLLGGCAGGRSPEEHTELIVFAAASLTESLTEIGDTYMAENEDVTLVYNFDSSGTLQTQIQEGAPCDLFLSAGQRQMDALEAARLEGSRVDLLENKVALVVPEGNPGNIGSFEDMKAGLEKGRILLALGNADVPVGQYSRGILAYYGLSEGELAAAGSITYGSNVKEIATQITESVVDAGIVYATDAFSAGLTVVDTATEAMCGPVVYPAAILGGSQNPEAAEAFLEYLRSDYADGVFAGIGFTPGA